MLIDVECHLSNSLPSIVIVGLANKAVDEAKERLRGAFSSCHIELPRKRITINLAPADVPKEDSGFDLAIAAAILQTSGQIKVNLEDNQALLGELSLDGSVRSVRGIIGKLLAGRAKGVTTFFIPCENLRQAQLVPNIKLIPVKNLLEFYEFLNNIVKISKLTTNKGILYPRRKSNPGFDYVLDDIAGQSHAKRALEIAAAGGHNILFSGPPGTGKSMLAKALPSIMPSLSHEEILEVTHIHSLVTHNYDDIKTERPFRAPHHSSSHVAITGGGSNLRPGEISLSHRGVLFFDELPEFRRDTLEALRQPLEDRVINVARAKETAKYPANFILIATANPCPCGYYGTNTECSCLPHQINRYRQKLSGPILDRIDLFANVQDVEHKKLLAKPADKNQTASIKQKINNARLVQKNRYQTSQKLNSDMTNRDIKQLANLKAEATEMLNAASQKLKLSPRSYMRTIKLARTIADLDDAKNIETSHISEALQYRSHLQHNQL